MGICRFCGKPAGFLRNEHKECREKYKHGRDMIVSIVSSLPSKPIDIDEIKKIADSSFIKENEFKDLLLKGFEKEINNALEDEILTLEEENALRNFLNEAGFTVDELGLNNSYLKFVKASVLREVLEGKIPEKVKN